MRLIAAFFIVLTCMIQPALADDTTAFDEFADFTEIPATRAIIKDLRNGGYVLFMRHGQSDTTRPDQVPNIDLNDCLTQRPLSKQGRKVAAQVGAALRRAGIPVGEVFSSPLCRAKDSASAAFGEKYIVNNLLIYTSNMTDMEKAPTIEATLELLSRPVEGRVNRVLVAHAPNLMDIIGYFPKEGTVVIFKPLGNKKFKYIASVALTQWKTLQP